MGGVILTLLITKKYSYQQTRFFLLTTIVFSPLISHFVNDCFFLVCERKYAENNVLSVAPIRGMYPNRGGGVGTHFVNREGSQLFSCIFPKYLPGPNIRIANGPPPVFLVRLETTPSHIFTTQFTVGSFLEERCKPEKKLISLIEG